MIYKSFNVAVLIRLFIFAILLAGLTILLTLRLYKIVPFSVLFIFISASEFVYFVNAINRKISFFFDAINNDDTTFQFPEKLHNNSLNTLHKSLNKLNKNIAEIKLKSEHNERFYREMMKYSAIGLMAIDENGYIEFINNSALELLGFKHISHIDLLNQKNKELYEYIMNCMPGQNRTIKLLHGTELHLLSLKVSFLKFSQKKYRIFSIHNIKAELEENELDSWQKLIRVLTHEIMNSIAPITSLSNTLTEVFVKKGKPLPVKMITEKHISNTIQGLDVIEKTGKGLMHFVENYRKLTKLPKPVFKPINIYNWLKAIELLMKNRMEEEKVDFRIIIREIHCELIGDEKLLNQVVINILDNALDALKNVFKKKILIKVTEDFAGKLKINIIDNGPGIPYEEIEKIFIPFYTTKENGSGIGLSLSRQIMRIHKGSISVFSRPEDQTTFALTF